ncbi:hypothetical protein BCR39DRAFT_536807 [Naematelia encephala]|uniref:Streptomycin biosynthesis protein StrI n=1 Tax=Naematelia encephala TaxID=71784 RepID=A0A1Y2AZC9_9TREE|nr:hypothetical protein BCR39DRAFT_536807 [Naematelia encephala]
MSLTSVRSPIKPALPLTHSLTQPKMTRNDDHVVSNGPMKAIIVGAGMRGRVYSNYALQYPELIKVVAVADPSRFRRRTMAKTHGIQEDMMFERWEDTMTLGKVADAVIIGLQDALHAAAVAAFSRRGYHILCEKPMATTVADCVAMTRDVNSEPMKGKVFAIGHVMRYSPYNEAIRKVIDSGALGDIVDVQHTEPVGNQHFAHSFVRGSWGNEKQSTFALMSKCCHDLDIVSFYMSGRTPTRVHSFGSLFLFDQARKPKQAGTATRCFDCQYESQCTWSAKKIYLEKPDGDLDHWMVSAVVDAEVMDIETVADALRTSQYGQCVYEAGNDVVDHQTVTLEYEGGATASIVMSAFSEAECQRSTRIAGTKGELIGDMESFTVFDFLTREKTVYKPQALDDSHGGGDAGLSRAFFEAVAKGDQTVLGVTSQDVLHSHLIVFAAEQSRKTGSTVDFRDFKQQALQEP